MTAGEAPIVFLLPSLDMGGTERHIVTLANGFAARRRSVEICTFHTSDGPLGADVADGVRVASLGLRRARHFARPLSRYLRRTRPRVLICAMHTAAVFGALARLLRLTDAPVVIFEGGFAGSMTRPGLGDMFRAARTRALYPLAARIITNAPGIADEIARTASVPRQSIAILPNPLDEALFDAADAGSTTPWPARYPAICTVARLNANKDVANIVRSVATLRATRPLSLVVIGDGPERDDLRALAVDSGIGDDTHFMGWQPHPWRLLRHAAVFAQASRTEGFSNALVEALAVGCPVVATDAPGATRFLLDGGRVGTLVPVGDVAAMAEAIARTLDAPCPRDMLVAQARALTGSSVDHWLETVESVALPVAGRGGY